MGTLELTLLIGAGSFAAGLLGALTGLGGGVVIVPLLTLAFGIDIRYAAGASLVSVIATSSGAAAAYVREGYSNIRIGMFLEIATSCGALFGAYLAGVVSPKWIGVIFGLVLLYSSWQSLRGQTEKPCKEGERDRLATLLKMHGTYPTDKGPREYCVRCVPGGFAMMLGAGTLSGLLGIGSGALKVIAMDKAMRLPFKVSTTTSNFMIGVTAAASAGIYLNRGYIDPGLSMPVMLGVAAGALVGSHVLIRSHPRTLRAVFAAVIFVLAIEMLVNSLRGRI